MANRTIPNPKRGCGHLKHGKAYARGMIGSPDGLLPSFVETRPYVPFKEIGTDEEFTTGYLKFDGLNAQIRAEGDLYDLKPLYPGSAEKKTAWENHVNAGVYDHPTDVPGLQWRRHVDRVAVKGIEGAQHWGAAPATGSGTDAHADLLMRVGQTHYPEPQDFIEEAVRLGISKAIPLSTRQEPPDIIPGQTRMWLVHPDACEYGWGVIGFAYLQEIVYTEPKDGNVPDWVQDHADTGAVEVVEIEDPGPENSSTLGDWEDGEGPDGDPQQDGDQSEDREAVPDADRQQDFGDMVVPDEESDGKDVTTLQALIQNTNYNRLKSAAAEVKAAVGQNPTREELTDALTSVEDPDEVADIIREKRQ